MLGYHDNRVKQVRYHFADLLFREQFVVDKTGCKMLELVGASFLADEPLIFGEVNQNYVDRELEWYTKMSLNVNDIPEGPPAIWKAVSSKEPNEAGHTGIINSNYGFLLYSGENYHQYFNVIQELKKNPFSRRAIAIYQRPSMHYDYNVNGMSDFVCTNAVQYLIRDGYLDTVVQMRSNDIWAGYRNDRAWQMHVRDNLLDTLNRDIYKIEDQDDIDVSGAEHLQAGTISWQVGSLHAYEKDFYLIDHFEKSGETSIKKSLYREIYPESPWK